MTFSSIMTLICVGYVLAYGGMVFYDLFIAKDVVDFDIKEEEEEIDISDEAMTFNPVVIDKDEHFSWAQDMPKEVGKVDEETDEKLAESAEEISPLPEDTQGNINGETGLMTESDLGTKSESIPESQPEYISDAMTISNANIPEDSVSASMLEESAREQAQEWMDAQIEEEVDTKEGAETEMSADAPSRVQTETLPGVQDNAQADSQTNNQTGPWSPILNETLELTLDEEPSIMTGAIEMDELAGLMDNLAENGMDSPLGKIIQIWNMEDAA